MLDNLWLIPLFPLVGAIVLALAGRRIGEPLAGWFGTAMCGLAFVMSLAAFVALVDRPEDDRVVVDVLFTWLPVGSLQVDAAFLLDPLSMTMCLFVTGIATLIHLYSVGYMHGDPKFSKFFGYLNLFVFSMLVLVLGDNLLVTFLGWEGVGVCSYLLISFWFTDVKNASAGKKAFITNRVGDWGFMIAMFLAFQAVGSLNYLVLNERAGELSQAMAWGIAGLLFVGAVGKSAQIPLYIWLPDAMAGPTPVSALIHAATMVTAGVYLMCRVSPVLAEVPDLGTLIAWVGIATVFVAATIAVAQRDIKKVLAYSTVSQLGYMFVAVGTGGYVAAIFHMVTHAFFKANLFLGAGSVIHGLNGEQDMRYMGALRKAMPITAATFIVGWLAIAGVPPFSGFWSKDEILAYAYQENKAMWVLGLIVAVLTAFYMTRQVVLVFFGKARWDDARDGADDLEQPVPALVGAAAGHESVDAATADGGHGAGSGAGAHDEGHGAHGSPHESPWTMWVPLVVLSFFAVVAGILNLPFSKEWHHLEHWLEPSFEGAEISLDLAGSTKWALALIAVLAAVSGIALGFAVYLWRKLPRFEPTFLRRAWYYDEAVSWFMGRPGRLAFQETARFDATVIDGAVNGVAGVAKGSGGLVRKLQSGFLRTYALWIGVGAVALLGWFVWRGVG